MTGDHEVDIGTKVRVGGQLDRMVRADKRGETTLRPVSSDSESACLLVEAASPLAATQLNNYFDMTIRRAIVTTNAPIHGVPIATVDFIPRPQQLWDATQDHHA